VGGCGRVGVYGESPFGEGGQLFGEVDPCPETSIP
jgi:hypothetical protein